MSTKGPPVYIVYTIKRDTQKIATQDEIIFEKNIFSLYKNASQEK